MSEQENSPKVETIKNLKKKRVLNISEEEKERRKNNFITNVKPKLDKYRKDKKESKNYLSNLKNIFTESSESEEEIKINKKDDTIKEKKEIYKKEKTKKIEDLTNVVNNQQLLLNELLEHNKKISDRTEKLYQIKKNKNKQNPIIINNDKGNKTSEDLLNSIRNKLLNQ